LPAQSEVSLMMIAISPSLQRVVIAHSSLVISTNVRA
jgi:hypothetical protein